MNFLDSINSCIKHYLSTKGRAPRSEYWYWCLFTVLVNIGLDIADMVGYGQTPAGCGFDCLMRQHPLQMMNSAFGILTLLPGICVAVRRLHDVNRNGWWMLTIIPALYWAFIKGTTGPNDYGADPLGGTAPGKPGEKMGDNIVL